MGRYLFEEFADDDGDGKALSKVFLICPGERHQANPLLPKRSWRRLEGFSRHQTQASLDTASYGET
jgi:hypothetical protein